MTNAIHDRRGRGIYRAEVVCKSKDGPCIVDGAVVGVLGVCEFALVDEGAANCGVLAGLIGGSSRLLDVSKFMGLERWV